MKKIYSLLILLSISVLNLSAEIGHLTWSVVGFDQAEWGSGQKTLTASDNSGNEYKVNVTFGRFIPNTRTQVCNILGKEYQTIDYISMYDNENSNSALAGNINYASYVLFEPVGDFYIKKIEFLGHSHTSSQSLPVLGLSYTGSVATGNNATCPYNTYNDETLDDNFQDFGFPSALPGVDICTMQGSWFCGGEDEDASQQQVKYVRLNWSGAAFAGQRTTDRGGSLDLYGFQIYTNLEGMGTSIEGADEDSFSITKKGDIIEVTTIADVKIYSLSGQIVSVATAVDEVSLESLSQGAYVVQAKDVATGEVVTAKIIK